MKRFTDTEKWSDPWFQDLTPKQKLLWNYLCDVCDPAGVWEENLRLATFHNGHTVTNEMIREFESRIVKLRCGKWWITKFIDFQYSKVSEDCKGQVKVIASIRKHSLPYTLSDRVWNRVLHTLQEEEEDKEGDKEGDKDKEGEGAGTHKVGKYHTDSRTALHYLNEKAGVHFREVDSNLMLVSERLKEPEVTIEGVKLMIDRQVQRWKGTELAEYLRPATLFGKSKFDSYYANRELPIQNANNSGNNQESASERRNRLMCQ